MSWIPFYQTSTVGLLSSSSLTTFLSQKFLLEIICRKLQLLLRRRQLMIPILWAKKSTTWPLLFMDMVVVLVEREWEIDVPIGFSESFQKWPFEVETVLLLYSGFCQKRRFIMDFSIQFTKYQISKIILMVTFFYYFSMHVKKGCI